MNSIYPLLFKPVYKDYLWGGEKIPQRFNRDVEPGIYAESWEVSNRHDGMSIVENGSLAGKTFEEVLKEFGSEILGASESYPLLIKLIDSKQDLSVQVHPHDNNKHLTGGEAKTEMWYILDADPGAVVYSGFTSEMDEITFMEKVQSGDIENDLQAIPVSSGDAIFTPGGRVHAIGAGCLILEVQQNSNTTYRIYDWGRTDKNGVPRDLHLEEACKVIVWNDDIPSMVEPRTLEDLDGITITEILSTEYFIIKKIEGSNALPVSHDGKSCRILFSSDTAFEISWGESETMTVPLGRSCLIPAKLNEYTLSPEQHGEILEVTIPG